MSNSTPTSAPGFRWLKAEHHDLDFWGIKSPIPWPWEAPKLEPKRHFSFAMLLEGIARLRADGKEWKPSWGAVEEFVKRGEEIGDAMERSDFSTALRVLAALDALRPGTAYCAFNHGFIQRAQGDPAGALASYVEATARAPKLEHLWMARGVMHEELEDEKAAIFCYRKALALLDRHPKALEGLARLGVMSKLTLHNADGTHQVQYLKPAEFERYIVEQVAQTPPDDPRLRSLLAQFRQSRNAVNVLPVLDRMLTGQPPDAPLLRAYRADALRLLKRFDEAERVLADLIAGMLPLAEAHYVKAWVEFDQGKTDDGYRRLERVLELDPNHTQALQTHFNLNPAHLTPQTLEEMLGWAKENGSWRAFWLASILTGDVFRDPAGALRHAETAYRLAPQERDAVFNYANCLNNMQEGEHTAALIHPRLPEAKGDHELKYVFAGAMKRLGLRDEAIRVLREILVEESDMTVEFRRWVQRFLDELTGLLAQGEIDPQFHPGTDVLQRNIWLGDDEGPKTDFMPAGVGLPLERLVQMTPAPKHVGTTGSICVYMHGNNAELDPLSLGWFRAHEIDFGAAEKPMMMIYVTGQRNLEATARQGARRLPVTWSLYRVPSMETEGK